MTKDEFYNLEAGDVIRNEGSGNVYIILEIMDRQAVIVRSAVISNPDEWELIRKSSPINRKIPRNSELLDTEHGS